MTKKFLSLALFALLLGMFAQNSFAQVSGVKPELIMYRHNSSNSGSPTPVNVDDILGTIKWNGLSAVGAIRTGATIRSVARQAQPGILAGNIIFSTSNGFTSPIPDRMIITESGLVGIGTMTPQYHLDVVGNTHTSGRFYGRIHFDNGVTTNDAPSLYTDEAYFERKSRTLLAVPTGGGVNDFGGILSLAPGGGAYDHQLFFGQDGIWTRREVGNAIGWSAPWERLLSSGDIKGTPNRIARFLPPDNPSNKIGDSQLFDDGTNVVIGPGAASVGFLLTVGGNTQISGNAHTTGNANIDGNAVVGATTTTNALIVTNNATAGSLNVNTDATVNNDATVMHKMSVGTATKSNTYSLSVLGGIISDEVKVQLQPWPDYVFEPTYNLTPLAEVEQYVQENKHLPGVVSAKEVAENGLDLGQSQKVQMEKIEELYLHMIALEKRINALETENAALKANGKN